MDYLDLYKIFRQQQAYFNNRPYKIPKDLEKYLKSKMTEVNLQQLKMLAGYFATKWQNIDPETYIKYGFELFGKNFTYTKFLDEKLMSFYIQKDKIIKRELETTKNIIVENLQYIQSEMKNYSKIDGYSLIESYCKVKNGKIYKVIEDYQKNKISQLLFVYFMEKRYIILKDSELIQIPYIKEKYREIKDKLEKYKLFIKKAESII